MGAMVTTVGAIMCLATGGPPARGGGADCSGGGGGAVSAGAVGLQAASVAHAVPAAKAAIQLEARTIIGSPVPEKHELTLTHLHDINMTEARLQIESSRLVDSKIEYSPCRGIIPAPDIPRKKQ